MKISIRRDGDAIHAAFEGRLTEDFDPAAILAEPGTQLVVDLAGVTRINSAGVREWIRFVGAVPAAMSIALERCPTTFLTQAGLISNFLGRAAVRTFYLPYFCPQCDATSAALLSPSEVKDGHAPPSRCESCGANMEPDVLEEQFFFFLR